VGEVNEEHGGSYKVVILNYPINEKCTPIGWPLPVPPLRNLLLSLPLLIPNQRNPSKTSLLSTCLYLTGRPTEIQWSAYQREVPISGTHALTTIHVETTVPIRSDPLQSLYVLPSVSLITPNKTIEPSLSLARIFTSLFSLSLSERHNWTLKRQWRAAAFRDWWCCASSSSS